MVKLSARANWEHAADARQNKEQRIFCRFPRERFIGPPHIVSIPENQGAVDFRRRTVAFLRCPVKTDGCPKTVLSSSCQEHPGQLRSPRRTISENVDQHGVIMRLGTTFLSSVGFSLLSLITFQDRTA